MINQTSYRRMLYVVSGLTVVVAVIVVLLIIPPTTIPENYIQHMWTKVIVHLLVVMALIWTIMAGKRGDNRKELQIIAGVTLIILGIIYMDHALAFHSRPRHEQPFAVSFWLFICAGCDILTGLSIIMARLLRRKRPTNH